MSSSPFEQESYFEQTPESLSLDKWQKTVDLIVKLFNTRGAWVMQTNNRGYEALVASSEKENDFPAGSTYKSTDNIYCKSVVNTKKHLYVKNAASHECWQDNPAFLNGFHSYLGVPLQWPNGNIFGTLCTLDKEKTQFPADFVELMLQLKEVIESDLHNMILIEKLKAQSTTDELTGIFNRRGFIEASSKLLSHAKRNKLSLLMMYFDLNNLKTVNDTYGHKAGDFFIKSFASAIANNVRNEDIIARLGGDEFCFLGICRPENNKRVIISRIKKTLETLIESDNRIANPTFSIGYKTFSSEEDLDIHKMLSAADHLMYKDKQACKDKKN